MSAFDYAASADPIREDLAEAYRRTWQHVAAPGTWLGPSGDPGGPPEDPEGPPGDPGRPPGDPAGTLRGPGGT